MIEQKISTQQRTKGCVNLAAKYFALAGIVALPLSTTLTDAFLLAAVLALLLGGDIGDKAKQIWASPVAWLFIAFFGLYVIGATYSEAPNADIHKALLKNGKLLFGALLIPCFIEQRWRNMAINALIGVITVIMLLSYAKAFGWISLTERYHDAAVFKSHIQTNFLVAFLAYLALMRAFDDRAKTAFWLGLFALATIKVFFFSHGRSGYIVFAALMALMGWQRWQWRGVLIGSLSVALIMVGALSFSKTFYDRFEQVITDSKRFSQGSDVPTSTALRLSFYHNATKMISERPLLGSGTGSVVSRYQAIEPNPAFQTHNPHNEYLNVGIQLGLIGMAFLGFFFARTFLLSRSLTKPSAQIAQATVVAIAVGCTMNSWLMDTLQGHFFAMVLAVCFASYLNASVKDSSR